MLYHQPVKSSLEFADPAFCWVLFWPIRTRYMIIDRGSAYGIHESSLPPSLYCGTIHCQFLRYTEIGDESWQRWSDLGIIDSLDVVSLVEPTLVKINLRRRLSSDRFALEVRSIGGKFTTQSRAIIHPVSPIPP